MVLVLVVIHLYDTPERVNSFFLGFQNKKQSHITSFIYSFIGGILLFAWIIYSFIHSSFFHVFVLFFQFEVDFIYMVSMNLWWILIEYFFLLNHPCRNVHHFFSFLFPNLNFIFSFSFSLAFCSRKKAGQRMIFFSEKKCQPEVAWPEPESQ